MRVLETKDLTKRFGGLVAVNGVSMHVDQGEIVGLIGPNGAGKSTLLNAIAGLDPPTSGNVLLFGSETTGLPPQRMCKKGLSRTFQIPRPFPKLTALENVKVAAVFGKHRDSVKPPLQYCKELLDYVEFPLPGRIVSERLNTVQLKRLDLARALASSPKLLLLDELAAGLTQRELFDLMEIIKKIRASGVTILMVEHIMQLIMGLCDRLVCIQFGIKIAEGLTKEVATDPAVTKAYLGAGHR